MEMICEFLNNRLIVKNSENPTDDAAKRSGAASFYFVTVEKS